MYWKEFLGEFEQFAQAQKVLSETIFYESEQEEIFGLKLALFSKFDFVIICDFFGSKEIKSLIEQLKMQKIKVISILSSKNRDLFDITLGFDYFQKGRVVANNIETIAKKKNLDKLKIAVITNTINKSISDISEVEGIKSYLKEKGIDARVYYPYLLHELRGAEHLPTPKAESFKKEVFSIPVHPYLMEEEVNFIIDSLLSLAQLVPNPLY